MLLYSSLLVKLKATSMKKYLIVRVDFAEVLAISH